MTLCCASASYNTQVLSLLAQNPALSTSATSHKLTLSLRQSNLRHETFIFALHFLILRQWRQRRHVLWQRRLFRLCIGGWGLLLCLRRSIYRRRLGSCRLANPCLLLSIGGILAIAWWGHAVACWGVLPIPCWRGITWRHL